MRNVDRDLNRILKHLRVVIRERGFIQVEVQGALGWGRSYISQLLNGQKQLRVEHVLSILKVIGVKPEDFYAEVYPFGEYRYGRGPATHAAPSLAEGAGSAEWLRLRQRLEGLVNLLVNKKLVTVTEIVRAIDKVKREQRVLAAGGQKKHEERHERQS